jgi:protein-disulfide isomerase
MAFGCRNSSEDKLDQILSRLSAVESRLAQIAGGGAAAQAAGPRLDPNVTYNVPVDAKDAFRGGSYAKVTLVEAYEFACPYCAMLATPIESLLSSYKSDELKVVSKHFIVHPDRATEPALAACAASQQGKFADFERNLWKAAWQTTPQLSLKADGLAAASLHSIAADLGLNMKQFDDDIRKVCPGVITRNKTEMEKLGVNGTPTLFINGKPYQGARTVEALKQAIDAEITTANAALAHGATLNDYYRGLVAKGKPTI